MMKLRINPLVAKDLKSIKDYIAEDNEEYAAKTIKEIYGKFENLQIKHWKQYRRFTASLRIYSSFLTLV